MEKCGDEEEVTDVECQLSGISDTKASAVHQVIIELRLIRQHQHVRDARHRAGQFRFAYRLVKRAVTQIESDAQLFWFDIDRGKLALFQNRNISLLRQHGRIRKMLFHESGERIRTSGRMSAALAN